MGVRTSTGGRPHALGALTERCTGMVIHEEWPLPAEQRDDPAAWRQFPEIQETINTLERTRAVT
jgi:hypothetical protein